MIAYALIGMPVNMILYTYLGEYFGSNVCCCSIDFFCRDFCVSYFNAFSNHNIINNNNELVYNLFSSSKSTGDTKHINLRNICMQMKIIHHIDGA